MSKFDAVLWDIDGTLLDFAASEKLSLKKCFEKLNLGTCTNEMVSRYSEINVKYWEALERGEMTRSQILVGRFTEFLKERNLDVSIASQLNSLYQETLGDFIVFMPKAKETVLYLKGKIPQYAVSNGTVQAQSRKLKNSGLSLVFDDVFLSEEVGFEKPMKEFFDAVFLRHSILEPKKTILIGDSLTSDIQGAINAGIVSCWFNPKHEKNTKGIIPDIELDDLSRVIELVL